MTLERKLEAWRGIIEIGASGAVVVRDRRRLREEVIDDLVRAAVFAPSEAEREAARVLVWESARQSGVRPWSIQTLYEAMGRGEATGFTTPAINLRGMVYDKARAVVRSVMRNQVGAFIFELARSEMGYTFQRCGEYATVVIAAALREGFEGPLFIQGDHYQVNAKKFAQGGEARATEIKALKDLIMEAIVAGYGNIDLDASTIVDLSKTTVIEQQRDNFSVSAELAAHVRSLEPKGMTISIGGEIGEVGKKNSTPEEFTAYMDGLLEDLNRRSPSTGSWKGPSKISVQTGTEHGGIPLPDGSVAKVKIDFSVLKEITRVARSRYRMSGSVQHGASTLPQDLFDQFPKSDAAEVHLATDFQNIVYEHPAFPKDLKAEMYAWLDQNCADERKPDMTSEQFYYKTRKKAWGPFKQRCWDLPEATRGQIRATLESKFDLLFRKLNVVGTVEVVSRHVHAAEFVKTVPRA
jgi:fructose/tagatose bisphosphate aldolase